MSPGLLTYKVMEKPCSPQNPAINFNGSAVIKVVIGGTAGLAMAEPFFGAKKVFAGQLQSWAIFQFPLAFF